MPIRHLQTGYTNPNGAIFQIRLRQDTLNTYLDAVHSPPQFSLGGVQITNREIFEVFTYGSYAHLTQAHKYEEWTKLAMFDDLRLAYDQVLRQWMRYLDYLADATEEIAAALPK